jgi:hypothetical protein
MTTTDRPVRGSAHAHAARSSRRRSDRLVTAGVVASYLHDIARHDGRARRSTAPSTFPLEHPRADAVLQGVTGTVRPAARRGA